VKNGAFCFQLESVFGRLDFQNSYFYISATFITRKVLAYIKSTIVTHLYILFASSLLTAVARNEAAGPEVREVDVIMVHHISHISNRIQVWEEII
jgi:hypothetical protein